MKKEKTIKYCLRKSSVGLVAVAAAFLLATTVGQNTVHADTAGELLKNLDAVYNTLQEAALENPENQEYQSKFTLARPKYNNLKNILEKIGQGNNFPEEGMVVDGFGSVKPEMIREANKQWRDC
ncbi:YSIRK-type signal peptide-containing protein [Streptococcus sp. X13SY08]|uniref:YSIRK-type signal peptide-containing protein n=1 Tax=Streptococcus sp. X13SY08 TaxID=1676616 RepID=UPI00066FFEDB|nr:YSIRK-type signal peptide-containing protein [Streptococcus sp. X13SY08]